MTERVKIFDTTLRDGEQSPGASLNPREKLVIAQALANLGVDAIEAGFPASSLGDFAAVKGIAEKVHGPIIVGLARCLEADIRKCAEAIMPASEHRIHVFLATSPIHRKFKLKQAKNEILSRAIEGVKLARSLCDDVEFSPEDASRTEPEFLARVVEAAIDAGASTVNIPDTVGYAIPHEFGELIAYLFKHVPNIGRAVVSVHCHNDLGLAVANSLAAVMNGARQVECTINGLGERAGNCALEEVVMALYTRRKVFHLSTGIHTQELSKTSRLVSKLTGIGVQRNKAVVGPNAFAHEAGIHQHGLLANRETYEIMKACDVGAEGTELVLGKHSGHHALREHLSHLGITLTDEEFEAVFTRFKGLADRKKRIYDDDLIAIAREQMETAVAQLYKLEYLHVSSGTSVIPTATVKLRQNGKLLQDASSGDGPVDAVINAIDRIAKTHGRLIDYSLRAVTVGRDAMGEVSVRVTFGKRTYSAKAASTDVVEASARAYLSCVNRYLANRRVRR